MKKTLRALLSLAIVLIAFSALASCKQEKSKEKFTETYVNEYFDTVTTVIGYAEDINDFNEVADHIEARLSEYHKLYDAYHSFTDVGYEDEYRDIINIKDINALVGGKHLVRKVDRKIIDLLLYSKEMYNLTGGETNVAMGSVLKLWHNERDNAAKNPLTAALPDAEALAQAREHTDINDIIIDVEKSTVYLSDPDMLLDVGAVAKGYATEMIARELSEMGVTGYALSVGGNVRTVGSKPDGTDWSIGIENPDPFEPYLETVYSSNKSIVTSGSYQRYYTVGNKLYHHIIDKDTLYPSVYYDSVSVVTENSAMADALSTALFCMPIEEGMKLVEGLHDVEALWLSADGVKTASSGFSKYTGK